jgi:FMN phosphatase YigB (HAD superfamily)
VLQTKDFSPTSYPRLDEVERRLRGGTLAALTTDVFDTVLWRTVPEPVDAFVALGRELSERGALDDGLDPWAFARIRGESEAQARIQLRAELGSPEVTLEEIWRRIPEWSHAPLRRAEALALELETEHRILAPDLEVARLLRLANETGIPVYAVSDTYFSAAQLARLLDQPGLGDIAFAGIFTSSDYRTGKGAELFDRVLATLDPCPGPICHLGDDEEADVVPARAAGIQPVHLARRRPRLAHLLRHESSYRRFRALAPAPEEDAASADLARLDGGLVQLRAKMALRRGASEAPTALRPMWLYGAEVLGPALAGFADWVVREAARLEVTRVHCLMREGRFLAELIDRAARAAKSELETTMLHLNRQVAAVASIGSSAQEEVERLLMRREAPTTGELLGMLGIDPALAPGLGSHLAGSLEEGIRRTQTLDAIWEDETLRLRVEAEAGALRNRIVRMVDGLRAGADGPFVLVDLGWGASIQRYLVQILEQAGVGLRVDGLYLLTDARAVEAVSSGGRVAGFLGSFGHPSAICDAVMRSPEVLEQSCMPDQGTQVGLTEGLEPILAKSGVPRAQAVEAAAVREGVRAFQDHYLRYREAMPEKVRSLATAADQLAPIVARSCIDPTAEEAMRFGRWHHDHGQGSDRTEQIAAGGLVDQVRHLDPEQIRELPIGAYWPAAVARLHDPHLADLSAAQAAGLLRPGALSTELETGEMLIEASEGDAIDRASNVAVRPRRNHHGLSFVRASLRAGHVARVQVRVGERPTLVRIDRLLLRLYLKDSAEVREVRLDDPGSAAMLDSVNMVRISDRVLGSAADHGFLSFATSHVAGSHAVYRVDVELSFSALAWDAVSSGRGGLGPGDAEAHLQAVLGSASWRLTRPLRALKRRLGSRESVAASRSGRRLGNRP